MTDVSVDEYLRLAPRTLRETSSQRRYAVKARESYDCVAPRYAEHFADELAHKPFDRETLAKFAEHALAVSRDKNLPVLDIGCGPGHISRYLRDLGVGVVGADLSLGMLTEARHRNPDIEFRETDMRSLPWADGSVAAIVAPYSIIHIPRDEVVPVLRKFQRVLVPGGWLLVSFHIGTEVRHLDELLEREVDLDFVFFATEEMRGYLQNAGFREIETYERDPYPEVEAQTRRGYVWARKKQDVGGR